MDPKIADDIYYATEGLAFDRDLLINLSAKSRDSGFEKYNKKMQKIILAEYQSLF